MVAIVAEQGSEYLDHNIDHEDGRSHLAIIMKSKADEDKCSPRYGATLTCAGHGDREDGGCITVTVTVVL